MHFSCATAVLHSCCNLATVLATVSAGLGWTTGWIQTQLGETGRCKNDPLELISGAMQATEAVVHCCTLSLCYLGAETEIQYQYRDSWATNY